MTNFNTLSIGESSILFRGNCKQVLGQIPSDSVDMVLTSPPYDNLRTYNNQEPFTFNDFKIVADELKRVIKKGGVIVWVVGDASLNGSETGTSFKQALYFKEIGLNLHDTMIYQKSGFNFPMINRYQQVFEYMFILSKGSPKTFNPIQDRPNKCAGELLKGSERQKDGQLLKKKVKEISEFGSRINIWQINNGYMKTTTDKFAYEHPAMFPEELAEDHIISWSNSHDVILDPFMGAGTTGKACKKLGRKFIGIELDKSYFEIAKKRIS
jgi:site-specific DNA-methyltransferase (adenine-specific)